MEIDIANNIKAIELIKIEILQNITDLFGDLVAEADRENRDRLIKDAARLLGQTYLLCSRVGISPEEVEEEMKAMLRDGVEKQHILERRFGDLTGLLKHLEVRRESDESI